MVSSRLRSVAFAAILALVSMLAMVLSCGSQQQVGVPADFGQRITKQG